MTTRYVGYDVTPNEPQIGVPNTVTCTLHFFNDRDAPDSRAMGVAYLRVQEAFRMPDPTTMKGYQATQKNHRTPQSGAYFGGRTRKAEVDNSVTTLTFEIPASPQRDAASIMKRLDQQLRTPNSLTAN